MPAMPATPQTPHRMRVIGGITGGTLRSPSKVQTTTTTTTKFTPKGVRVRTVVDTVEIYEGEEVESSSECSSDSESDIDFEDDYEDFRDEDFPDTTVPTAAPPASRRGAAHGAAVASDSRGAFVAMRKVYKPTPPGALVKFRGPCYILARAQETGIYRTRKELMERIAGLGRRAVWERRKEYTDAEKIYTALYNAGLLSAEPQPGSCFANNPYDLVPAVSTPLKFREPDDGRVPPPTHFRKGDMYKYYVVTKGEQVGIYGSWVEASARVDSLRCFSGRASWMRYNTWGAAVRAYTVAYHLDEVAATPVVGGYFDCLDRSGHPY